MLRRPLFWSVVSVLCLAGAVYFWRLGDKWQAQQKVPPPAASTNPPAKPAAAVQPQPAVPAAAVPAKIAATAAGAKTRYPFRLSNTDKTSGQLLRDDKAIHLMNALIDTGKSTALAIPDRLRAPSGNGSYVVQARGPLDNDFRALLQNAGASIVSYIPNNAYLVRVSDAGAQQLQNEPQTQAVLPYEPYYKLEPSLLSSVMTGSALPTSMVKVTLFPDASPAILNSLNLQPIATEPSPFGQVVTVPVTPSSIVDIARLPGVQAVAPSYSRKSANDLDRPRLGVSADSLSNTPPYLGLSGSNVLVSINDTGVDMTHPDLTGRIFGDTTNALTDTDGHGTHVAGTILGNGTESPTVTNASGSVIPGASFRGMATNANAYVIALDTAPSDAYLQEQPASTNALISNNSWNYGDAAYDIEAASYDAAVRDALPQVPGSQPLIFVFSAGNNGNGTDDGQNGQSDSILSPATAKNVITVGAIEQLRNITNTDVEDGQTNQPFLPSTDSDTEVASFSSRGNVGIQVEGDNGRFKPDMVAPGTFVISTRSTMWDTNAYYNPTNVVFTSFPGQSVDPGQLDTLIYPVPANPVEMIITVVTNNSSPSPFPQIPIYVALNQVPTSNNFVGFNQVILPTNGIGLNFGDTVYFAVGNPTNVTINYDVDVEVLETNGDLPELLALEALNNSLSAPPQYYRYESGTSMAAAGVTGMLACMEDFFINQLKISNASPALMKALLINGARSLSSPGQPYDFQVGSTINYQGWGLPNLPNSIPPELTNFSGDNSNTMPILFFDQNPASALATGQSGTRTLQLTPNAASQPLRITLVWTDPPGNPNVGIKLVNDLDLIVTNMTTGDVYYGNDIPAGSIYNEIANTNGPSPADAVNNVENVYLPASTGTNFSITVYGHHVNVNAVTVNTNNVVQDYALVISTGDAGGSFASPFTLGQPTVLLSNNVSPVTPLSNGVPLLNERIGANSQYAATTNGMTNQWNFYVYTNTASLTNANFTNVAILTFFPPNLSVPRMGALGEVDPSTSNATRVAGADIDLYVSTDPNLTNLNPTVISNAFAQGTVSVGRTGDETVVFTNSGPGQIYYIGIKSEDQEGAQYGLAGVASDIPFSQTDSNGNTVINMTPIPAAIPGGSSSSPQYVIIFGVSTQSTPIRKVTVEDSVTITNFGDLVGTLTHGQTFVTLNNHTAFTNSNNTTETLIYDDSGEGNTPGAVNSAGPGNLQNFVGANASGSWLFTMVNDSGPNDNGTINSFQITVSPQPPTNGVSGVVVPGGWFYDFIDVPENCTNLTVSLGISAGSLPLDLYIKRGAFPTQTDYDKFAVISPPGGAISISSFDSPPLNPGRYFIAIFNPNTVAETFFLSESLGLALTAEGGFNFLSVGNEPILDDAVTYSTNYVGISSPVVAASVGVRIDHPRVSDLVLTLISPQGTRVLLAENRGGLTTNYGSGTDVTNSLPETAAGDVSASTNVIGLTNGLTSGTLVINYQFFTVPDDMRIYYGGERIFDSGLINGGGTFAVNFGPGTSTNVTIIMNEPGSNPSTNSDAWNYTATIITEAINYTVFTEDTNLTTLPIKFAPPPFGGGPAFTQPETIVSSGFEGYTNGTYTSVDGWTASAPVTVATVPALAFLGSNVLALHQGTISRTLPTVQGTTYTLTFAVHGRPDLQPVSWWEGESNTLDTITTPGNNGTLENAATYAPGLVGGAFDIIGFSDMRVPDAPSLEFTNTMTAEVWIFPTNTSIGTPYSILTKFDAVPVGGSAYSLGIDGATGDGSMTISPDGSTLVGPVLTTSVIPTNQWTHIAATYDGNLLSVFFNGILQGQITAPGGINPGNDDLSIGGTVGGEFPGGVAAPFSGLIDEATVYSNTLTTLQIQDIYAAGSAGKVGALINTSPQVNANVYLAGALITNVSAGDAWTNYSITFNATSDNMALQFAPGSDGVLLDQIVLTQNAEANSNNYFLPEESLSKVVGENPAGAWQLEILDNRAGPPSPNPTPVLVSWELSLLTETLTPTATPLTEAIPQSNTVSPNSIVYYVVNVPPWALYATNMLFNVASGGPLNLLFNQNFEPGTTTNGGDVILMSGVASSNSTYLAVSNGIPGNPPLIPGQSYYLGVQNTGTTPASFSIQVNFDITTLTNMVPVTNTLAASSVPRYYQFDVGTNYSAATFQLLNVTGNVDLVVSEGPPLPTLAVNAYGSTYLGSSTETITVLPNSQPVPLSPGRWYLGVFNNDVTPQTYTIMASEFGPPTIIPLTNAVPFTTNFPPGPPVSTFFSFTITNTNSAVLFELYDLSGNVDLTVDRGTNNYPYQPPYFAGSFNPGTNREQIVIRTNTGLNGVYTTNLEDIWYLGVPNNESSNVTFTIRAVLDTNGILPSAIPITVGIQNSTNGLTFTWPTVGGETYELVGTTNLLTPLTNWPVVATITNAPPYLDTFIDTNSINGVPDMFYSIWQVPTP